jgi:hypothetical protein
MQSSLNSPIKASWERTEQSKLISLYVNTYFYSNEFLFF